MRLYLGNLHYEATEDEIRRLFAPASVSEVKIVTDRDTGKPRGFGFVEIPNEADARTAIKEVDGRELRGRRIVVNEARHEKSKGGGRGRSRDHERHDQSRAQYGRSGRNDRARDRD